ncbi:MAG: Do family serine endopeptidase [Pseudomonadota bacterium]|nr:Do family serine endopeptidase [Pseudomonadota bacterium]
MISALARKTAARLLGVAAIACALTVMQPGLTRMSAHAQGPASVADLAESLIGSVVNISTSQKVVQKRPRVPAPKVPEGSPFQDFFDELFPEGDGDSPPRTVQSQGAGFVIDASGIIVTNNHVVGDADEIVASFNDGTKLNAEVIGRDPKTDIAVLRVDAGRPLPAVTFGDSDGLRIGDWVLAIGNPFGFGRTVTLGIVSAIGRDISSGPYDNYIQTDASINKGNSGGPLFNMEGEVVGINTAIISPTGGSIGLGFAIPTSLAKGVIDQLIEYGETRRGWLGVQIQTVTEEIAETLGMDKARGALVGDVVRDGPADRAGIKPGDVVLKFDGKDVEEMRDLPKIVADTPVDKQVDVVVLRKGEEITVETIVGRLEDGEKLVASSEDEPQEQAEPDEEIDIVLGMRLKEITGADREAGDISSDVVGVLVVEVEPGSNAADKGIEPGEVLVEVGQEPVSTPKEVLERIEQLQKDGRKNALLMVSTKTGDIRFVVLRIEG